MAPLDGIRIVDFTTAMAGPSASMLLADFGADVVKVEPPGGESSRTWGSARFGPDGDFSGLFLALNRNKSSVVVDLRSDDGLARAHELIRGADVVMESFKPGGADRLGVGYDRARELRADLVYLSISGFGQTGPLRSRPGYDQLLQAYAGHMSVTGEPAARRCGSGRRPSTCSPGAHAAYGVMLALRERDRTGEGQHVETSLYDSSVQLVTHFIADYTGSGSVPRKSGGDFAFLAPYGMFQARDREFYMGVGSERMYASAVRGDRPARPRHGPALRPQRRADRPPRGARRRARAGVPRARRRGLGGAVHGAGHPGEPGVDDRGGRRAGPGARARDDRRDRDRRRPHGGHPDQAVADARRDPPAAARARRRRRMTGVAVAGIGTAGFGRFEDDAVASLADAALSAALDDAGLERARIDGLASHIGSPRGIDYDELAMLLGLRVRWATQTWEHGRFGATVLMSAAMALAHDLCDYAVCIAAYENSLFARIGTAGGVGFREGMREGGGPHAETPHVGMAAPIAGAAMSTRRYLERYGDRPRAAWARWRSPSAGPRSATLWRSCARP